MFLRVSEITIEAYCKHVGHKHVGHKQGDQIFIVIA